VDGMSSGPITLRTTIRLVGSPEMSRDTVMAVFEEALLEVLADSPAVYEYLVEPGDGPFEIHFGLRFLAADLSSVEGWADEIVEQVMDITKSRVNSPSSAYRLKQTDLSLAYS